MPSTWLLILPHIWPRLYQCRPERELVFERFYRVLGSDPEGENLDGSGLGLAIVREIAYQHRALMRISGREHASGRLYTVVFPPASVLQPGLPPDAASQQRIL